MIYNQHIRNDYSNWGIERVPRKRVTTMCGKMTLAKYAAIPGITKKPLYIDVENKDFGWCLECSEAFFIEVYRLQNQIVAIDNADLVNLYINAVRVINEQIKAIDEAMSPN
jgi:hypothetical protein